MECRFNTLAKQLSVWSAKYVMWGKIYSSQTNILQVRTTIWKFKIIIHFNIMFSEFQKTSHGPQFFFLGALIFFFSTYATLKAHGPKSEGQFPNLGNRIIWLEFEPNCSSCCANSLRWLKKYSVVLLFELLYMDKSTGSPIHCTCMRCLTMETYVKTLPAQFFMLILMPQKVCSYWVGRIRVAFIHCLHLNTVKPLTVHDRLFNYWGATLQQYRLKLMVEYPGGKKFHRLTFCNGVISQQLKRLL